MDRVRLTNLQCSHNDIGAGYYPVGRNIRFVGSSPAHCGLPTYRNGYNGAVLKTDVPLRTWLVGSNPTVGVSGVIWCPDHNLLNSKPEKFGGGIGKRGILHSYPRNVAGYFAKMLSTLPW